MSIGDKKLRQHFLAALTGLALVLALAGVYQWWRPSLSSTPPSLDNSVAWQWLGASPGLNAYIYPIRSPGSEKARAWIALRASPNAVQVRSDRVELWEFDCRLGEVRRISAVPAGQTVSASLRVADASAWERAPRGSVAVRALSILCAAQWRP